MHIHGGDRDGYLLYTGVTFKYKSQLLTFIPQLSSNIHNSHVYKGILIPQDMRSCAQTCCTVHAQSIYITMNLYIETGYL